MILEFQRLEHAFSLFASAAQQRSKSNSSQIERNARLTEAPEAQTCAEYLLRDTA